MTSRKINSRKLSFQQLEDRQLMAANLVASMGGHLTSSVTPANLSGNVTAAVVNNGLTITGDSLTDIIKITQVAGSTNKFTVAGVSTSTSDTSVNGLAQQTFTVKGSISVNFKNGTDILLVGDATSSYTNLPGSLNVVYGTGAGNNLLMNNTTVGGNLHVSSGNGIDFEIHNSVLGTPAVNGGSNDCYLSSKGGYNFILLDHTSVERDLLIYDGSALRDQVYLTGDHVGRNATIETGAGDDTVAIDETYFVSTLNIQTGGGDDLVVLGEHLDPSGNQSPNKSAEYSVHADKIFADLGDGDDLLYVNNLYGSKNFDGGAGIDDHMVHDDGQNIGSYAGTTGFESIDGMAPPHATHHVAVKA